MNEPFKNKNKKWCPGWVVQLVLAASQYAKIAGSISDWGTCKNLSMIAWVDGAANLRVCFFSLYLPFSFSEINNNKRITMTEWMVSVAEGPGN